jgi:replicative DNA helicase
VRCEKEDIMGFSEERTILGSLIYYPETRSRVIPMLKADDFSLPVHRQLFKAIVDMVNKGQSINVDALPSKEYVSKLKDKAVGLDEVVKIISAMRNEVKEIQAKQLLELLISRSVVPTGYEELDRLLSGGFEYGSLVVIKGVGRKGIVFGIIKTGKKILFYSLTLNLSSFKNLKVKSDISQLSDIELDYSSLKPDVIVIDSLEGLSRRTGEDSIFRELKSLAKRLNVPIVVLSEEKEGLLEEPDVVMSMTADSIIVEKNRNGEIGKVEVR